MSINLKGKDVRFSLCCLHCGQQRRLADCRGEYITSRAIRLRKISLKQQHLSALNMTLFPGVALVTGAASGTFAIATTANIDKTQASAKQQQSPSSAKAVRRSQSQISMSMASMKQQS
jgi:hypothetical protein